MASLVTRRLRPLNAHARLIAAALAVTAAALAWLLAFGSSVQWSASRPAPRPPHPMSRPGAAALSPQLARLATARPAAPVRVIVQLAPGARLATARNLVRSLGGRPGVGLHIINALSAELSAGAAKQLASSSLIRAVSIDAALRESSHDLSAGKLASVFNQSTRTGKLWHFSTGAGIGVAVIDTGIAGDAPDFRSSQDDTTSRVTASAVIDPSATTAADTYGHGTAVGGLVAGNGSYRDDGDPLRDEYAGTAPDANLISLKISDDNGQATTLGAIYALQFALDHRSDYNIRVVNMSFRSTAAESAATDPLDAAVEQAWLHGIVVVAAAGNNGSAPDAVSYAPANDPYAITVGALDEGGTKQTSDDVQTDWSSRGVTQDGFSKPDVLAPGAHIVSTLAPDSAFATLCPGCIVGGSYFQASGTSLAAPIVSGIVADLLAAHPDWTPDMVKGAIVNTAVTLASGGAEISAIEAYRASGDELLANQNLTPNGLIDPSTGTIDPSQANWAAGSWSTATSSLAASWSAASWSCQNCSSSSSDPISPTAASWSTVGWATFWG